MGYPIQQEFNSLKKMEKIEKSIGQILERLDKLENNIKVLKKNANNY